MKMRKVLFILTAAVCFLLLWGCKGEETPSAPAAVPSGNPNVQQEMSIVISTPAPTEAPTPMPTPEPTAIPSAVLGGETVPLTDTVVKVESEEEFALLEQFFALEKVDASALVLSVEQIQAFKSRFPQAELLCGAKLADREAGIETEEWDLHEVEMTSPDAVMAAVGCLPNLKKVDMRRCGLTNEQMETLVLTYPQVKFVWEVKMGPHTLRTDIVGFSTKNPGKYTNENSSPEYVEKVKKAVRLTTEDIAVLKFCTDLVALDLGHNYIDDISVLQYLPKLQILILADNKLTDISVFRELPELVYVEFFMNKVTDLSPLEGHDKLLDLNFCNNDVSDLSPLEGLTQLERVWCAGNEFSRSDGKALQEKLPNAQVNYTAKDDTADGWREHERYTWMRAYFKDDSPYNPS